MWGNRMRLSNRTYEGWRRKVVQERTEKYKQGGARDWQLTYEHVIDTDLAQAKTHISHIYVRES